MNRTTIPRAFTGAAGDAITVCAWGARGECAPNQGGGR